MSACKAVGVPSYEERAAERAEFDRAAVRRERDAGVVT